MLATTLTASLLVIPDTLSGFDPRATHALPEGTWSCLVRVSSFMMVSLISYRCARNRKALSYFRMLFSLLSIWHAEKEEKLYKCIYFWSS